MWNKPWRFTESFCICAGLIIAGLMLQFSVGAINWSLIAFPVNIILLVGILLVIVVMHLTRKRVYIFRWMATGKAAIPTIFVAALMTIIMGLTPQVASHTDAIDPVGITKMLSFWPFVFIYTWLELLLGMIVLEQLRKLTAHHSSAITHYSSLLSHTGLFVALLCGTLGNGDMQRLKLQTEKDGLEWRGVDDQGGVHELDLAVCLHEFSIDMYPAKLIIVEHKSGKSLPLDKPDVMLLEEGVKEGYIDGWHITIDEFFDKAASTGTGDSLKFVAWPSMGGCCALKATAEKGGVKKSGYVSCGSFMFPYTALELSKEISLVMPEREPKRFASDVTVYTQQGEEIRDTIEVNKPLKVNGWKIYQLSYDETMGEWSQTSIFEMVRDPWLPYVYVGIFMMLGGAVMMFFRSSKRKEDKQ